MNPVPLPISALPLEFTVPGPPVSHQSSNRQLLAAWQQQVRTAAAGSWRGTLPLTVPLRIVVVYYHNGAVARIDMDNMLKPIQDALIGLVYDDDVQITDAAMRKTPATRPINVFGQSLPLLQAFAVGQEFVHVLIDHAPDHSIPLR